MLQKTRQLPLDAVVAVTYRCNSRCVMCNIWQIKDFPEMPPEAYLKLPNTLCDINISGGEPFLREDLSEIVKNIKIACPRAKLIISTNGFLTETIAKVLPKILEIDPKIGISISVDGIGAMHEAVRRVPNAWAKVLQTINFCRSILKMKNVKLAFTLNSVNYSQLQKVFHWSKRLGVQFTMAIAHSSDLYFGKDKKTKIFDPSVNAQFKHVINHLLTSLNPKDWVRAYFIDGLQNVSAGMSRPLKSFAGEDFFYIDPKGDVYPSVIDNIVMGNLFEYASFLELWTSPEAQKARAAIAGFESDYWMVCTARTAILRNPLKVAQWIFNKKFSWKK